MTKEGADCLRQDRAFVLCEEKNHKKNKYKQNRILIVTLHLQTDHYNQVTTILIQNLLHRLHAYKNV